jgi:hypothetical protein
MRPLTLQEFAEDMRRKGDIRDTDLADEILDLLVLEEEVAEPYSNLCADLEIYAPVDMAERPERAMEWLGDRSNLLADIEKELKEANRNGDVDDVVKELLGTMEQAEAILEAAGWPGGDFLEALQGLAERAARAPEEVEIIPYDL